MRKQIIDFIFKVAKESNAFEILENEVKHYSKPELLETLIEVGILPECFDHDSSEEKIWSKYSDILLAQALTHLNIESTVLGARGNSADVIGKTNGYTLVADAKTFRLSRTAKNQKDFKVTALDSWRGLNNYSMLVSPLYQYPKSRSQIYKQAITRNVTLFSYTHLKFLIINSPNADLTQLFDIGQTLQKTVKPNDQTQAVNYWHEIDRLVLEISGKTLLDLEEFKLETIKKTQDLGSEEIEYWSSKIDEIKKMSKEQAINELIHAKKIDQKIRVIQRAISDINMYS